MFVGLLYENKDWDSPEQYFDRDSIIKDLGLETLFQMASKEIEWNGDTVRKIKEGDPEIAKNMEKVMMVPLQTKEEILYRQGVLKDCMENEEFIITLYQFAKQVLLEWKGLGRGIVVKTTGLNSPGELVNQIHVLNLFLDSLGLLKRLLAKYEGKLQSTGMKNLTARLREEFSEDYEARLRRVMEDIQFYTRDTGEKVGKNVTKTKMKLVLSYDNGMKFKDWKLQDLGTDKVRQFSTSNPLGMMQSYVNGRIPDSVSVGPDSALAEEAASVEYHVVNYVLNSLNPFLVRFRSFFDQLLLQTAFYRGAVLLNAHMKRMGIKECFPNPVEKHNLAFVELKEVVMALEQLVSPIGNSCKIENKNLMIVTGANQGGKSTFLRSVGIAQIMMQCGLTVAAISFESGVYPEFFTHFTRREDSEMNSGRLDEELGRMSQIIDHIGQNSIVLLNESFATTTEKDGSQIAYDIMKALQEKGVEVLTVTHLLGFARRMYEEEETRVRTEFLSAGRLSDGQRTFKMEQGEPSLQSFGLDLYEKIIGKY